MHTITTRAPTEDESRIINGLAGFDFASYGCLTLFFGIVPVYVFGVIGGWIGRFSSPEAGQSGRVAGWIVAVTLFVVVLTSFARFNRRRMRRVEQDRKSQQVQEIHVVNPRVIQVGVPIDHEPVLAFDIGDGRILLLQGQWFWDPAIFGAPDIKEDDAYGDFVNRLPPPYAFPSTEFTVTCLPNCGEVFAIHVSGGYLDPGAPELHMEICHHFGDCELFAGSLDNIAGVLQQEHQRRQEEEQATR
jgi:hypothetical protein